MTIRFHLDESVTATLAQPLAQRGIDVTTPADVDLFGATDETQLAFARENQRVFVTHDVDFLLLHSGDTEHAGIVYCHQSKYTLSELLQMLTLVHACYAAVEIRGRVEYI